MHTIRARSARSALGLTGCLLLAALAVGCGQPPPVPPAPAPAPPPRPTTPPPPTPPVAEPGVILFSSTNETVDAESLPARAGSKSVVRADFNLDGRTDMAVAREVEKGSLEVAVFLAQSEDAKTFFRAGTIRRQITGKIIGLMSQRRDKYVDLLVLLQPTNGPNQIIQYRNDGTKFEEAR